MWSLLLAAAAFAAPCPDNGVRADYYSLNRFWGLRAVEIVRAGIANDLPYLRSMVSPEAKFEIWQGDATGSARANGADGVVEMVHDIKPTGFSIELAHPGPYSLLRTNCDWEVTVRFERDPAEGAVVKFSFIAGMLATAKGDHVDLVKGRLD